MQSLPLLLASLDFEIILATSSPADRSIVTTRQENPVINSSRRNRTDGGVTIDNVLQLCTLDRNLLRFYFIGIYSFSFLNFFSVKYKICIGVRRFIKIVCIKKRERKDLIYIIFLSRIRSENLFKGAAIQNEVLSEGKKFMTASLIRSYDVAFPKG